MKYKKKSLIHTIYLPEYFNSPYPKEKISFLPIKFSTSKKPKDNTNALFISQRLSSENNITQQQIIENTVNAIKYFKKLGVKNFYHKTHPRCSKPDFIHKDLKELYINSDTTTESYILDSDFKYIIFFYYFIITNIR